MQIKNLNHASLRTQNMEGMIDFYTRVLGFAPAFQKYTDQGAIRLALLHIARGVFLELSLGEAGKDFERFHNHLCFEVESIHQTYQEITALGLPVESPVKQATTGMLFFYTSDPDGNRVELAELVEGSLPAIAGKEFV